MKQFYVIIDGDQEDSYQVKHIQYNIIKRIEKIKYYKYRRLDIKLDPLRDSVHVDWNDKSSAGLTCGISSVSLDLIEEHCTIEKVYDIIFEGLRKLWMLNGWNQAEISAILINIKNENYQCITTYGKILSSPNKKLKAKFSCEIFPSFANYYLEISNHKNEFLKSVLFFKGQPNLLIFFLFFPRYYWLGSDTFTLSNRSKEISFVFNIYKEFVIEYTPYVNTLEECENYIQAFGFEINKSTRLKLISSFFEKNYDKIPTF